MLSDIWPRSSARWLRPGPVVTFGDERLLPQPGHRCRPGLRADAEFLAHSLIGFARDLRSRRERPAAGQRRGELHRLARHGGRQRRRDGRVSHAVDPHRLVGWSAARPVSHRARSALPARSRWRTGFRRRSGIVAAFEAADAPGRPRQAVQRVQPPRTGRACTRRTSRSVPDVRAEHLRNREVVTTSPYITGGGLTSDYGGLTAQSLAVMHS